MFHPQYNDDKAFNIIGKSIEQKSMNRSTTVTKRAVENRKFRRFCCSKQIKSIEVRLDDSNLKLESWQKRERAVVSSEEDASRWIETRSDIVSVVWDSCLDALLSLFDVSRGTVAKSFHRENEVRKRLGFWFWSLVFWIWIWVPRRARSRPPRFLRWLSLQITGH